jgi:hypothetical protein
MLHIYVLEVVSQHRRQPSYLLLFDVLMIPLPDL